MSSQRKIDSARANGALSHGPKTPEGRALSAAAAITHGLTARRTLAADESEEAFRALREMYARYFQPATQTEFDWLEEFIATRWRLIRITSMETALLTLEVDRQVPQVKKTFTVCETETRLAMAFRALSDDTHALDLLNRYEARIRRTHDRLYKRLDRCRKKRARAVQHEPNPINEHPQP